MNSHRIIESLRSFTWSFKTTKIIWSFHQPITWVIHGLQKKQGQSSLSPQNHYPSALVGLFLHLIQLPYLCFPIACHCTVLHPRLHFSFGNVFPVPATGVIPHAASNVTFHQVRAINCFLTLKYPLPFQTLMHFCRTSCQIHVNPDQLLQREGQEGERCSLCY